MKPTIIIMKPTIKEIKSANELCRRDDVKRDPQENEVEADPKALFDKGDGREFKRQFAVQFLASWSAVHYMDYCARGMQESLEKPPVEDAEYLAQKAWDHWCAILPGKTPDEREDGKMP